jgi:hypothetical protein
MRSIGLPELLVVLVFVGVLLIPAIFYLLTLQRALQRCAEQCRTTSPGSVWLMLIPLFNFVYSFILVGHMASSLRNEFVRRSIPDVDAEPGKSVGIAMCVLNVASIIPIVGVFAGIAGFVCWIIYWVRISNYSNRIAIPSPASPAAY